MDALGCQHIVESGTEFGIPVASADEELTAISDHREDERYHPSHLPADGAPGK